MLQLIQPIGLLALTGIVIPVVLHLWNNKQGKVLAIGSIALLEKDAMRQSRSRRLSEWLLLVLRCLLLAFLALLLSGPFWKRSATANGVRGWVLVDVTPSVNPYQRMIDSLVKSGYELHKWAAFQQMASRQSNPEQDGARLSYWTLFGQADRQATAGIPFYVFAGNRLSRYTGLRPVTRRPVYWQTYPAHDSAGKWIEAAWLRSPDSIRVLVGNSRPTGNTFHHEELPVTVRPDGTVTGNATSSGTANPGEAGDFHIGHSNGQLTVALDSQPPVIVDTTTFRVVIFAENQYSNDSRYLSAAIRAITNFSGKKVQLMITDRWPDWTAASRPDWLFWLSAKPLPPGDLAEHILLYEQGREVSVDSWIREAGASTEYRRVEGVQADLPDTDRLQAVWQDGYGYPVLAKERRPARAQSGGLRSGSRIFHFYSRFNPSWNELVWDPSFPGLLEELLFGAKDDRGGIHDLRIVDPVQATPVIASTIDHPVNGTPGPIELAPVCWIIIFLLLVTERVLSFLTPKTVSNG